MRRLAVRAVTVEMLEGRRLLAATTLRVVTYNLDADTNGQTAPNDGVATVLTGIGAYAVNGTARPLDVLALQETTSNAQTVQPIVDALNTAYGAGTYAASPLQLTESNGDPTTGNGPSALVYNTKTVALLESYAVPGALGASTGVYRQIGRYELRPVGGTAAGDFYVYVDHYKSGTGDANAAKRQQEAAVVRQDEAALPAGARVIYAGDFNTSTAGEGLFATLMAGGQGQAFDPRVPNGAAGIDEGLASVSESATNLRYRDDYELVTSDVLNDAGGLKIVAGSEQVFGNDGSVAMFGSVADASNTALPGLPDRAAVLQALTTASDHLPVIADYTDVLPDPPAGGSVAGTITGGKAGQSVYLDANNNAKLDPGEVTTTTTPTGKYTFSDVPAGAYVVRQVLAAGYTQVSPTKNYGLHVTVKAGVAVTGQNFTDRPPAATPAGLAGYTFNDANGDGKKDGADTFGSGKTVYLDANNNGRLDTGEKSTVTGSDGVFKFTGLAAGTYHVRRVFPGGYAQSTAPIDLTLTAGQMIGGLTIGSTAAKTKGVIADDVLFA